MRSEYNDDDEVEDDLCEVQDGGSDGDHCVDDHYDYVDHEEKKMTTWVNSKLVMVIIVVMTMVNMMIKKRR